MRDLGAIEKAPVRAARVAEWLWRGAKGDSA